MSDRHDADPEPAEPTAARPQPVGPPAERNPVDPEVRHRLAAAPDALVAVSVRFTVLPDATELARLGMAATGVNPVIGMVDAARLAELAARDDVLAVVAEPDSQLF